MTMTRRQHTAVICIGSNSSDAGAQMRRALAHIVTGGIVVACTPPYPTAPEGVRTQHPYTNRIVILGTGLTHQQLLTSFKAYETARRQACRHDADTVAIDIDIVVFDDEILRPPDYAAAYFRQGLEML